MLHRNMEQMSRRLYHCLPWATLLQDGKIACQLCAERSQELAAGKDYLVNSMDYL